MIEASSAVELIGFEQVEAAPGTVLLRVAARPSPALSGGSPRLVVEAGGRIRTLVQLPGPPGPPDLVRLAYPAGAGVAAEGARFALELEDGTTVPLPSPRRRRAPGAARRTSARIEALRHAREQSDAALASHQTEVEQLERAANARAEAERERLRGVELDTELAARRRDIAELVTRAEETDVHLAELAAVVRAETARREELQVELARAREELESALSGGRAEGRLSALEAQLLDSEAARLNLATDASGLAAEREQLIRRIRDLTVELDDLTHEREAAAALRVRVTHLEGELREVRDVLRRSQREHDRNQRAKAAASSPVGRPSLSFDATLGLILLIVGIVLAVLLLTGLIQP